MRGGTAAVWALGALTAAAMSGCSSGPDITAAGQAGSPGCVASVKAFPQQVSGQSRLSVDVRGAGAWGDPAIIARCGLPALTPTQEQCIDVDGVGWVAHALSDGTRMTTFGTDPALQVLIPKDYAPAPLLLPAFDAAAKALPRNGLECRG